MSFGTLVTITNALAANYPQSAVWDDSPFKWLVSLPPGSKGAVGRNIASALLQSYGMSPGMKRFGLRVNGQDIVVKTAMLWEGEILKFQNIGDTKFDHVFCLGLFPNGAVGWLVPKDEIWADGLIQTDRPGITKQHKGADAWLNVDPSNVPEWLKPYGGTIEQVMNVAQQQL